MNATTALYDDPATAQPSYLRAFLGGCGAATLGMLAYAVVHGLVLASSGYEYLILMIAGGVGVGFCARVGAGYAGGLPALIGGAFTYLAIALGAGGGVALQFLSEGEVLGAILTPPLMLIGMVPIQLMEGDGMGIVFLIVAIAAGFMTALVEPRPEYDRY